MVGYTQGAYTQVIPTREAIQGVHLPIYTREAIQGVHFPIYTRVCTRVYTTLYIPQYTTLGTLHAACPSVLVVLTVCPAACDRALGSNLRLVVGMRRIESLLSPRV